MYNVFNKQMFSNEERHDILNRRLEDVKLDQIDNVEEMVNVEQRDVKVLRDLNYIEYVFHKIHFINAVMNLGTIKVELNCIGLATKIMMVLRQMIKTIILSY